MQTEVKNHCDICGHKLKKGETVCIVIQKYVACACCWGLLRGKTLDEVIKYIKSKMKESVQ